MDSTERSQSARDRRLGLAKELGSEYLRSSSLHGLRFLPERDLSALEKIFWIGALLASVALCSLLICRIYEKWNTTPIIIGFSEKLVFVDTVPSPSVTICPHIKVKATVYNFTEARKKYKKKDADFDTNKYHDISMLCHLNGGSIGFKNGTEIIEHIKEVAPDSIDILASTGLNEVYTQDGLCFNVNGLAANEILRDTVQSDYKYSQNNKPSLGWSMETGYSEYDTEYNYYPIRAPLIYPINLNTDADDYDIHCNGISSGYRIYLHHPADFPQSSDHYYDVSHKQLSSLAVTVHSMTTSKSLSNVSPETRQCYFQQERYLRYFKIYTAQNCRLECLSNYTFAHCKCVAYYMPHSNSSEICANSSCPKEAETYMTNRERRVARGDLRTSMYGPSSPEPCRCLPLCDSVEYEADVYTSAYNYVTYPGDTTAYSIVKIYFKKPMFRSIHRSELFGLTDFLANIGGLLGLFLGFSVLSLVEIMYYCTLRLGFAFKRDSEKENQTK